MILKVDKNGDGKISYSEFRVMLGAIPLIMDWNCLSHFTNKIRQKLTEKCCPQIKLKASSPWMFCAGLFLTKTIYIIIDSLILYCVEDICLISLSYHANIYILIAGKVLHSDGCRCWYWCVVTPHLLGVSEDSSVNQGLSPQTGTAGYWRPLRLKFKCWPAVT